MGAVSGDVNTISMSVLNAADLGSRPVSNLRSGDRAFLADRTSQPEGPLFFLDKSSTATVDGVGVLATLEGVGRWLSEAYYGGSGSGSAMQVVNNYVQPALSANVTMTLTSSSLSTNEIFFVPGGGYYSVVTNNGDGTYVAKNIGGSATAAPGVTVTGGRNLYVSSSVDGVVPAIVAAPGFVQPAVGVNVVVPFTTQPTWAVISEILYVPGGGYYEVEAIGINQLTLSNTGATGNAAPLTAILQGTIAVPLAQAGQQIAATTPLSFPTIAALRVFNDVAIPDNSAVWVESVRAFWRKKTEADLTLSDDITNVRNAGNTATWYRETTADSSWAYLYYANGCFVDTVTGDDENVGTTVGTALRSLNEFSRRIAGEPLGTEIEIDVYVGPGGLSNYASDNLLVTQTLVAPPGYGIRITGRFAFPTVTATVAASTNYTPGTVPQTAADRQQVTVGAGFLWARNRVYLDDDRFPGWALSGVGSGAFGAASADTHFTRDDLPFGAPAIGRVIYEYQLPVCDTIVVIGGRDNRIDRLEIGVLELRNTSLPIVDSCFLTLEATGFNVNQMTLSNCRLDLLGAAGTSLRTDGELVILDSVIDDLIQVACTSLISRRNSINGAAVVGGAACLHVVGGVVASGTNRTRAGATHVVHDNIELRDNAFLLFGKTAADVTMDATPMDVMFAGSTATPSYIFGRDNVAVTEPIKLLNAGIRLGYNGDAAGTPTVGSGTVVSVTHTGIANTYSYKNPGGVDPTVLTNAGLPSVNASNFVGIYRYR